MLKNQFDAHMPSSIDDSGNCSGKLGKCRSYWKLNEWQIRQYRHAIEENKWYMSEREGRAVGWDEAERDFMHNGYYGCAVKWRKEYCARRCGHFTECKLGQLFADQ